MGITFLVWCNQQSEDKVASVSPISDIANDDTAKSDNVVKQNPAKPVMVSADWIIYNNTEKDYSINYPADAKIDQSDLTCVQISTKEFGSVSINVGSLNPCGEPTGLGVGDVKISENMTIGSKQYLASGYRVSDNSFSFQSFTASDTVFVTYGVAHFDKTDSKNWKNLGALTDAEYQTALDSARKIVSTLHLDTITEKEQPK